MAKFIDGMMTKEAFIAIFKDTVKSIPPVATEQFSAIAAAFESEHPDKKVFMEDGYVVIRVFDKRTEAAQKKRFVVCAACRQPDSDLIFCGPRHFDMTMQKQIEAAGVSGRGMEQGFVDQHGVFMDREEAMQVAKAAGQPIDIKHGCGGNPNVLYSEGLY